MAQTPPDDREAEAPGPEDELESSRAPFMEHLEELRWRLWRAVVGVLVCAVVCYIFHKEIYQFLTTPLIDILEKKNLPTGLKFRTVTGAFIFHFKTALLGGIFFGIPVVLWQFWQFVAPGLYSHERKLAVPFVLASTICFLGGGAFAYFVVMPYGFDFLLGYTVNTGAYQLQPDITVEDYLGFVTKFLLAFGLIFELPVATAFLSGIGVVTHRALIKFWRWFVVVAFIIAAVLTPPDWVTQILLAIPLILLYGFSIGIAYFITTRRERRQADTEDEPASDAPAEEPPSEA
jgi:sec-independent protein translocase protein TatC